MRIQCHDEFFWYSSNLSPYALLGAARHRSHNVAELRGCWLTDAPRITRRYPSMERAQPAASLRGHVQVERSGQHAVLQNLLRLLLGTYVELHAVDREAACRVHKHTCTTRVRRIQCRLRQAYVRVRAREQLRPLHADCGSRPRSDGAV